MGKVLFGDCREVLQTLEANSVDAIVCDPPYELGFMGKKWDSTGVAYDPETWRQALRVLKPGGHLLAFGGTRTYHRMAVAIEDAGFEIRDCLQWLYGQGFPKSLDISKAIDREAGAEREVIGKSAHSANRASGSVTFGQIPANEGERFITAPATDDARTWQGFGTGLKPANEPIVLARKPCEESTIAKNVLKHGTGALNVDACRIDGTKRVPTSASKSKFFSGLKEDRDGTSGFDPESGRWPTNVILDEHAAKVLDEKSGVTVSTSGGSSTRGTGQHLPGLRDSPRTGHDDIGGASRFFYVAKAAGTERDDNNHPTVKPIKLMRYLIRLITPPGGTVLDLFGGSGTTGIAAQMDHFDFVLIEKDPVYFELIRKRIADVPASLFDVND